jgi:hypothetical protein
MNDAYCCIQESLHYLFIVILSINTYTLFTCLFSYLSLFRLCELAQQTFLLNRLPHWRNHALSPLFTFIIKYDNNISTIYRFATTVRNSHIRQVLFILCSMSKLIFHSISSLKHIYTHTHIPQKFIHEHINFYAHANVFCWEVFKVSLYVKLLNI